MVGVMEFGSTRMCRSMTLFLGYFSLLHPLKTIFIWTACVAYCASILFKHLDSREILPFMILHYKAMVFSLFCVLISAIKFRSSSLFEKSTLYRLGTNFRARRLYRLFLLCAISSVIVSSGLNGNLTYHDLFGLGLAFIFIDWSFISSLIKVSLTAPMSGYPHFDHENYLKLHSEEAVIFFSTMDNVVLDHFIKLLLFNIVSHWPQSDVGIVCERLKTHLTVAFVATFSLLPVLTRINFANSPQNAGFFDFRMPHFILKESSRTRSESEPPPQKYDAGLFQSVYSSNRHTAYLSMAAALVIFNAILAAQSLAQTAYFGGFPKMLANYFTLMSVWLCIGSYLILVSFFCRLKHLFALDCTCEICIKPKLRRSRMRSESEYTDVLPTDALLGAPIEAPLFIEPASLYHQNQHHHDGDNEADENENGVIPKSPKLECVVKARVEDPDVVSALSDAEVLRLIRDGRLKTRDLETAVKSLPRAVALRRQDLATRLSNPHSIDRIPFANYDYRPVMGQCCEEVIGYIPIPLGKVGPLLLDGQEHYLPLATTEGCLVASTNRGCRALYLSGGVRTALFRDQMTRAPVVAFPSVGEVVKCIAWIESPQGFQLLREAFNETSSYADLVSVFPNPVGRYLHLRFAARTGEAMGMNMVSKGTERALRCLGKYFPRMQVLSLSGNMCTDKKSAVINHLLGRGKSVLAEARLPGRVISRVFHTEPTRIARLARVKHWTGSAMAGVPGMAGCNAHAANLVAALFAATGQDLAQVVDSSACLTQLEVEEDGSLYASVTMPCIEVGTVGGGTRLPAQRACIEMLDLSLERPAEHLARLVAGVVIAGELSLLAALATNDLVEAHMRLNRAAAAVAVATAGHPAVEESKSDRSGCNDLLLPNADNFGM
ncbi:3-hydroxy-3-methylglutaryl-coenzyme A reductase [Echinococcus granulosus]|nr:3-hydroxy-3-methylglutaryl-coenzyme A reductase [Echinococcus granulosus]